MRTKFLLQILILFFPVFALAQASNDASSSPTLITSASNCNTGDLYKATNEGTVASSCGTTNDVWYTVSIPATAIATTFQVTIGGGNPSITTANTFIEVFDAASNAGVSTASSLGCSSVGFNLSLSLTPGRLYYFRIFTTTATNGNFNKYGFTVCVNFTYPPTNDDCSGAISLIPKSSCTNVTGSLNYATASAGIPLGCFAAGTYYDVWYSFTATQAAHNVTLSGLGSSFSNPMLQIYSGSCGALVSLACGTTSVTAAGLTAGTTYYVRVANAGSMTTNGAFSICVTSPTIATYEISRTYINVTKGSSGGTVDPGDTLEMRAILAITSNSLDSLSFIDTLYNANGLRLVPGSLAWRTNEGKIYGNGASAFSDAHDTDPAWYETNGLDTIIHINIGAGASGDKRGALTSTSFPRVFGSPCLIMATYRVVVYAAYNSVINFKTGALTYRDPTTGIITNKTFPTNNLIVYSSPGLCPNAVSATNALGAEYNGTFGVPSGGAPLARNRGTTPYIGTGYNYKQFNPAGGPNDYYYGIANNTSSAYTTINTWPKPDASGYRVFQQWDITGDHTGASDPSLGNPACDTTQPVSPTNPCGYMLIVNSAYRADTAFTYTVNNLCPNTYYEISGWFKNICYKCGADSLGRTSSTAGYIPTAPGDSSGVRPNIAFDVNGVDYYTTGDIFYTGVTPTGSDATNQWAKRGFVYLTGPSETSFLLTLRNNAPGGGGNDWALDDIAVTTCLPNMQYSPSLNPTTCNNNPLQINDTIRSYFSNYSYYKWQKSTDAGTTWSDISSASGTGSPVLKSGAYEYVTSYEIPPTETYVTNTGDKYRVVVATTAGNLSNADCQFTDGISIIGLDVLDCGNPPPLDTYILSFNGANENGHARLNWTTKREDQPTEYIIEKSADAFSFTKAGSVKSGYAAAQVSAYTFTDPDPLTSAFYRITAISTDGRIKVSRTIHLKNSIDEFSVSNVTNYFHSAVSFDVSVSQNSKVDVSIFNTSGNFITQKSFSSYKGTNSFTIPNLDALVPGLYILQVRNNGRFVHQKIIKR